jgi:hypothetical protein
MPGSNSACTISLKVQSNAYTLLLINLGHFALLTPRRACLIPPIRAVMGL